MIERWVCGVGVAVGIVVGSPATMAQQDQQKPRVPLAGPVSAWPRVVPARVGEEAAGDDLLVMTLGEVSTPLANAKFDPSADRLTRADGSVVEGYYAKSLGIPYFKAMDKSVFAVPPSGWCSWYFYYQELDAAEVMANARWIAENLRIYGARYVQIDDAWQGRGHGLGDNRDWTTIDPRFGNLGALAEEIRKQGLAPGIWIAPHGQSNERVARESGAFLTKPDGTSASNTWEGTWLVDPTKPEAGKYLGELFARLRGMGFSYFKIDGQPIVLEEFEKKREFMAVRPDGADAKAGAETLYRGTLEAVRGAIGKESYLLGCWGIPLPGMGIMNGSRTGGDIVPSWEGFLTASDAVERWNFLHNVAWYCDPDVMLVRPPLTEGTARCWATVQGLTGQALMASDRMPDLPASRVEMVKRVFPAVDIRPLDLVKPERTRKPVWDLKVSQRFGGMTRAYDVVGVFNFGDTGATRLVSWSSLGLDPTKRHHVYDFWRGQYLGCFEGGVSVEVPERDVRVLTVVPEEELPVVLSTSRHITQGWVDLVDLSRAGEQQAPVLRGRARVIAGEPYVVTLGMPSKTDSFKVGGATAISDPTPAGRPMSALVNTQVANRSGWATVTFTSAQTQEFSWQVDCEKSPAYHIPVADPPKPSVRAVGLTGADVGWGSGYYGAAAYEVVVDGRVVAGTDAERMGVRGLEPGREHAVAVRSVWWDGTRSAGANGVKFEAKAPETLWLSEMEPARASQSWGTLRRDRSVDGNGLTVARKTFERGLGTHADSTVRFEVGGAYSVFEAEVGIDDEVGQGKNEGCVFEVWADGKRAWESGPVRSGDAARPVRVEIAGAKVLELRVRKVGESIDFLHADWGGARVSGLVKKPEPAAQEPKAR